MEPIKRIEVGDKLIRIFQDEDAPNPRGDDNLGTLICWHRGYDLGDRKLTEEEKEVLQEGGQEALKEALKKSSRKTLKDGGWTALNKTIEEARKKGGWEALKKHLGVKYLMPLGLLDHSGLHIYVGGGPHFTDTAGWDSGTVGWIMATPESIQEMGVPEDQVEAQLEGEVETYDQYLRGDVYGYVITRKHDPECDDDECHHDEQLDSCWGFYGLDYCEKEALGVAGEK